MLFDRPFEVAAVVAVARAFRLPVRADVDDLVVGARDVATLVEHRTRRCIPSALTPPSLLLIWREVRPDVREDLPIPVGRWRNWVKREESLGRLQLIAHLLIVPPCCFSNKAGEIAHAHAGLVGPVGEAMAQRVGADVVRELGPFTELDYVRRLAEEARPCVWRRAALRGGA